MYEGVYVCVCLRGLQSFCAALHHELTEYYRLIAILAAQVFFCNFFILHLITDWLQHLLCFRCLEIFCNSFVNLICQMAMHVATALVLNCRLPPVLIAHLSDADTSVVVTCDTTTSGSSRLLVWVVVVVPAGGRWRGCSSYTGYYYIQCW